VALLALFAVLTAALMLLPLRRPPAAPEDDTRHDHLRRLDEFAADLAAGDIDAEVAPAARAELERAVVDATVAAPRTWRRGSRAALALVVIVILAATLPLYHELGMPRVGEFALENPGTRLGEPRTTVRFLLGEVRRQTVREPDDREAWEVLARTTLSMGEYDEAVTAAERVVTLAPADDAAKLLLVDALAMREGGRFGERARALVEEVLARDADNVTAMVIKGIALEQSGARDEALALWRRARAGLPADAPFRAELESLIARFDPAATTSAPTAAAAPAAVEVTVSLAPALLAGLDTAPPGDTAVFVLARAVDGPPAPLAVARHRLDELPLTTRLDAGMAMLPGASLADFDAVYVVARVARGGSPQAQAGDLEGRSAPFAPAAEGSVEIVIDTLVE
ncbi:MAG: c-type cytochrome biogenesis protein CcmI, partial [Gammaproteobacteria bacterium]